ncbi:MAG: cytochrome c biogenesis CcdA family protein [Paracoccaceae bacterium]|nr:cytochrome c biogenesis CcdA family protein [Paracoccaceae bacterium]
MELFFGYLAGLLTLINPCVLPVLPIVLASATQASRLGPVALAAGMGLSFVALGLAINAAGRSIGLTAETVASAGAVVMVVFGAVLVVPRFSESFASATAGLASGADARLGEIDQGGLGGQFATGALLGAVWSPCIGPTLGGAIALASQGQSLSWAGAVMASFALGVSTIILALAYGARSVLARNRAATMALAEKSRPIMGWVLVAVGTGLFFNLHHVIEFWALETLPPWLMDLSVSY